VRPSSAARCNIELRAAPAMARWRAESGIGSPKLRQALTRPYGFERVRQFAEILFRTPRGRETSRRTFVRQPEFQDLFEPNPFVLKALRQLCSRFVPGDYY